MNNTEHCKVLVLHDDKQWGELFQLILNERSDEVTFASDGQQGLDIVERDQPDLIFVYLWTPKLNAFEFYEQLKNLPAHSEIPVVFYGAAPTERMNAQVQPLGAAGYLCLPCTPDELIGVRDTVLRGDIYYVSKGFQKGCLPQIPVLQKLRARRAAQCEFRSRYPEEHIVWTKMSADETDRYVIGVFYGDTRPPRYRFYAVKKQTGSVAELEDVSVYRPKDWR